MPHIAERELELPDAVIGTLLKAAAEDKTTISLGPGEPDFPLPQPLVQHIKEIAGRCNHYSPPGGIVALREAIARKLKKDNKINAQPENIIVTAGSQEALLLAAACTLDVSEQIIIPSPSFLAYLPTIELFNAAPQFLQLKEDEHWQPNPDALRKLIDKKKTKALIINSPANPTGAVLERKTIEEIADIAVEHDLYVFSDEAYEKIIYDKKHVSPASLNGMEKYVLTFQTFSKSYAMAGFRLGYCVAPAKLAGYMAKTHVYTSICAPTISQLLGIKALALPSSHVNRMVKEYRRRRDFIVPRLNALGLYTTVPDGAFYTFSRIRTEKNSQRFARQLLHQAHVAVVPGSEFGSHDEGYIRCSFATDYKLIEEAMDRIERYLNTHA